MNWTDEQKAGFLVRLPWTIEASEEDGEIVLRIPEVPGVLAQGDKESVEDELWNSLRASLEAVLHFGDEVPRPRNYKAPYPWEPGFQATTHRRLIYHTGGFDLVNADIETEGRSLVGSNG